jgi:hypothetical protein
VLEFLGLPGAGNQLHQLFWLQARHICDGTYATALAELVNAPFRQRLNEIFFLLLLPLFRN